MSDPTHDAPGSAAVPSDAVPSGLSKVEGFRAGSAAPAETPVAVLAEFADVDSVMTAAAQVRDAGFTRWDVHTPFPVHGMDKAMGVRPTILPWITLACGLTGLCGGLFMVFWINAYTMPGLEASFQGYEFLISGKPLFSLPANIPIIFETTVLLAALGTVAGMFALNGLPMLYHPLFKSARFRRVTSDRFVIVIDTADPRYDPAATAALLQSLHPLGIETVTEAPDAPAPAPRTAHH